MWKKGKYKNYSWSAKVYDQKSSFGINDGRVFKLHICDESKCVFNYDRGVDFSSVNKDVINNIIFLATDGAEGVA